MASPTTSAQAPACNETFRILIPLTQNPLKAVNRCKPASAPVYRPVFWAVKGPAIMDLDTDLHDSFRNAPRKSPQLQPRSRSGAVAPGLRVLRPGAQGAGPPLG